MRIHKEGYRIIPIMAIGIILLYILLYGLIPTTIVRIMLAAIAGGFLVLIVRFFRDPLVITPEKEGIIYAPADGKIVIIKKTYEGEWLEEYRTQISIFMSPLNVHVNRSPIEGRICYFRYHPGKYMVAWHPKSSTHNEHTSIGIETETGIIILMRQIAGAVARRIAFYPDVGHLVCQGTPIGFIRFGSRVDLFLPLDADIKVRIGDLTKGGITELASLMPATSMSLS